MANEIDYVRLNFPAAEASAVPITELSVIDGLHLALPGPSAAAAAGAESSSRGRSRVVEEPPLLTAGPRDPLASLALWPHQVRALASLRAQLKSGREAVLAMACGTGKTRVFAELARDYDLTVVFSKYIDLNSQNRETIAGDDPELQIDCEHERSAANIIERLMKMSGPRVIFSTFDSAGIVAEVLKAVPASWSVLIVVDEYHLLEAAQVSTARDSKDADDVQLRKILHGDESIRPRAKVLGVSATPRLYFIDGEVQPLFGRVTFEFSLAQAIEAKVVLPPRLLCLSTANSSLKGFAKSASAGAEEKAVEDLDALFRALGKSLPDLGDRSAWAEMSALTKAMAERGAFTALFFVRRVAECERAAAAFRRIVDVLYSAPFWAETIDYTTDKRDRTAFIRRFSSDNDAHRPEWRLLTSVRVLAQGIDVPNVDFVAFQPAVNPSTASFVFQMQIIGRGQRLAPNKCDNPVLVLTHDPECLYRALAGVAEWYRDLPRSLAVVSSMRRLGHESEVALAIPTLIELRTSVREIALSTIFRTAEYFDRCSVACADFYAESEGGLPESGDVRRCPTDPPDDPELPIGKWLEYQRQLITGKKGDLSVVERHALRDKISRLFPYRPLWYDLEEERFQILKAACRYVYEETGRLPVTGGCGAVQLKKPVDPFHARRIMRVGLRLDIERKKIALETDAAAKEALILRFDGCFPDRPFWWDMREDEASRLIPALKVYRSRKDARAFPPISSKLFTCPKNKDFDDRKHPKKILRFDIGYWLAAQAIKIQHHPEDPWLQALSARIAGVLDNSNWIESVKGAFEEQVKEYCDSRLLFPSVVPGRKKGKWFGPAWILEYDVKKKEVARKLEALRLLEAAQSDKAAKRRRRPARRRAKAP